MYFTYKRGICMQKKALTLIQALTIFEITYDLKFNISQVLSLLMTK